MDNATNLGEGNFSGFVYPATLILSRTLKETAKVRMFDSRVENLLPRVKNSVLIFTGNGDYTST